MHFQDLILPESHLPEEPPSSIEKTKSFEADDGTQSLHPAGRSSQMQNLVPESSSPDELQSSVQKLKPNLVDDCTQTLQSLGTVWGLMLEEKVVMDRISRIDEDIEALMAERKKLMSQQTIIKQKQYDALNSTDATVPVISHAMNQILLQSYFRFLEIFRVYPRSFLVAFSCSL